MLRFIIIIALLVLSLALFVLRLAAFIITAPLLLIPGYRQWLLELGKHYDIK